jgi:hypothetical protein
LENFRIETQNNRCRFLAYWYEQLTRHLLHLPQIDRERWGLERALHHFDIDDEHLNTYVEVKGSASTDQLKLFVDQLDAQIAELGFPFSDGYIWIFGYRNRKRRHGKRLLKRSSSSWEKLSLFLAEHTNVAYVVDVRLLSLIREKYGNLSYKRDPFNPREIVAITRMQLGNLAVHARTELPKLGIPLEDISRWLPPQAQQLRSRTIKTTFDGRDVSFKLVPLLPNGFKTRLLRQLNGTVHHDVRP